MNDPPPTRKTSARLAKGSTYLTCPFCSLRVSRISIEEHANRCILSTVEIPTSATVPQGRKRLSSSRTPRRRHKKKCVSKKKKRVSSEKELPIQCQVRNFLFILSQCLLTAFALQALPKSIRLQIVAFDRRIRLKGTRLKRLGTPAAYPERFPASQPGVHVLCRMDGHHDVESEPPSTICATATTATTSSIPVTSFMEPPSTTSAEKGTTAIPASVAPAAWATSAALVAPVTTGTPPNYAAPFENGITATTTTASLVSAVPFAAAAAAAAAAGGGGGNAVAEKDSLFGFRNSPSRKVRFVKYHYFTV